MEFGLNKVRYQYYYGQRYYDLVGMVISFTTSMLYFTYTTIRGEFLPLNLLTYLWAIPLICGLVSLLILKIFVQIEIANLIRATMIAVFFGVGTVGGIFGIFTQNDPISLIFHIIVLIVWVIGFLLIARQVGIIKIYPNRVIFGKRTLMYESFVRADWGMGEAEEGLTKEQGDKQLSVITSIVPESHGRDITIYNYHIILELENEVIIAQSTTHRNQFGQNLRNAWLETWRWDGTTTPPEDWLKDPEKIKLIQK